MHISQYIEEDFRLATATQVRHYDPAELHVKPHLPGFALTQLLDQLNGHVLATPRPRFWVRAPGGTAFWLTRHLGTRAAVQLWLSPAQVGPHTRHLLVDCDSVVESDLEPGAADCCDVTCVVLACLVPELGTWYTRCRKHPVLGSRPILAYDPTRQLRGRPEGEYFLNSSIWVTRDHGT